METLTLINETASDASGARETSISFKGTQSGGEVTTLAKIVANHSGAADDQKGKLDLQVNDGSDGDVPTSRLSIDTTGLITQVGGLTLTGLLKINTGFLLQQAVPLSAAGPTDNVAVGSANIVAVDTSSNNVTIGGFSGGYTGQILYVVIVDATNNTIIENAEGGGAQDIYLESGGDETKTATYGGWTFYCNGTSWFQIK